MAVGNGNDNNNNNIIEAHIEYKGKGRGDVLSDDLGSEDVRYDVEPIGYFEFLVKHRNRIVDDSIAMRLSGDQVKGLVKRLEEYISDNSGAGLMLMISVDDSKSSMLYQDGIAIQDFVIKINNIIPLEDSKDTGDSDQDASGQLVFDWS